MTSGQILCVGELLWDSLPAGLFLGGAPYNVAGHLHALGMPVAVVSRVGRDRLGAEAIARVARHGIATDLIQEDARLPTGFVTVTLDADGAPTYEIVAPAAWDAIQIGQGVQGRVENASAIVFGSLAQRAEVTRETIRRLCRTTALKVFDVNLRPPFVEPEIVRESLLLADLVKLNEQELKRLGEWYDLPEGMREGVEALARDFGCPTICVTRGDGGAFMLRDSRCSEHPGYRVEVQDTVGAGDAFLAALLRGILSGDEDEALLAAANLLGAYVASRTGAIPEHDESAMAAIRDTNTGAGVGDRAAPAPRARSGGTP